jgi:hypothetical protein
MVRPVRVGGGEILVEPCELGGRLRPARELRDGLIVDHDDVR